MISTLTRILPLKQSRFARRAVRWESPLERIVVDVPVNGGGHIVAIFLPLKDWAPGLVAKEWTTTVVDRGLSPGDGSATEIIGITLEKGYEVLRVAQPIP